MDSTLEFPDRPDDRKGEVVAGQCLELLSVFLTDAESDIGIAALDNKITDTNFIRLRRARDRVTAAQRLLETMRGVGCNEGGAAASPNQGDRDLGAIAAAMREAVELLAKEWPEDYPDGAVEWLMAEQRWRDCRQRRSGF